MESLQHVIAQHIRQSDAQRITFSKFMELALYHPQFGYYATPGSIIGPQGDFITSPHMGHDFGEVIAEQFADMWVALGRPKRFDLVEMGAGQGLIAGDAIAHLQTHHPQCFQALNYIIIEKSAALQVEQQKRLSHWQAQGVSITWETLENISKNTLVGCAFSNELVDAFPVHLVELHQEQLKEVWITYTSDKGFTSLLADLSTSRLVDYFKFIGIDFRTGYAEGYRTEVNLAALDWLAQIESKLKRGYLLTIDYGHTAQRYYSPARKEGTLQCYYQHSHHSDPFIHIGKQDITAHVDFTALEKQGEKLGLEKLG
ncbi:MAG: SAM-dependent methyltransferase, partial [Cyanobacteria bacterium J06607_10]